MSLKGSGSKTKYLDRPVSWNHAAFDQNGFTISLWLNLSINFTSLYAGVAQSDSYGYIAAGRSSANWWSEASSNTQIVLDTYDDGTRSKKAWYHQAVIYKGTSGGFNLWLYINGTLVGSGVKSSVMSYTESWDTVVVGTDPQHSTLGYIPTTSLIAELAMWPGVALNATEIGILAAGQNPMHMRNRPAIYHPLKHDLKDFGSTRTALRPYGGDWVRFSSSDPPVKQYQPMTFFAVRNAISRLGGYRRIAMR